MNTIKTLLDMGGYGIYVWPAYILVAGILGLQWFLPWKHWENIRKTPKPSMDCFVAKSTPRNDSDDE